MVSIIFLFSLISQ